MKENAEFSELRAIPLSNGYSAETKAAVNAIPKAECRLLNEGEKESLNIYRYTSPEGSKHFTYTPKNQDMTGGNSR